MLMYAKGFQWVGALCESENYAQTAQAVAATEATEAEAATRVLLAQTAPQTQTQTQI